MVRPQGFFVNDSVGFIGAGQLGEPMIDRLLGAGHNVHVYARRADVRDRVKSLGASLAGSVSEVAATSGGKHEDSPVDHMHVGYLKQLLGFIGITDVEVVRASGLAMGDTVRAQGIFTGVFQAVGGDQNHRQGAPDRAERRSGDRHLHGPRRAD